MLRFLLLPLFWITVLGQPSFSYTNFDECLKAVSGCDAVKSVQPTVPPKKLKAFLDFVVSAKEKAKYDCVKKHFAPNPPEGFCAAPAKHFEFHSACNKDILKFCKQIQPGDHRLTTCLEKQSKKLAPRCLEQLPVIRQPFPNGGHPGSPEEFQKGSC